MSAPDWVKDAVFYQIFPDRFARSNKLPDTGFESWDTPPTTHGFKGGDLYGVIEKLDYLKDLGINAIYFNPIFASASNHRYHTYDYYKVDPLLGGNEAFRLLLDAAHKRGIRVVLDGVFNHASRGFWQFNHVLETGAASPYKDWFYFDPERLNGHKHWGAYPTPHEQKALQHEDSQTAIGYRAWWNLPALPKFNTSTPAVREFLFGVAEYWIRIGIDGWRLDVPADIDDDSFWQEFRQRVRAINPDAYIVGEIWHDAQRWLQGDQFDAVMNYVVTKSCLSFFAGKTLDLGVLHKQSNYNSIQHAIDAGGFASQIDYSLGLYDAETTHVQLNLLDSHDTPRFLSCASGDESAFKLAWLFLCAFPGAPCLYYGNEVGVDGKHDPECRKSFPWDESKWNQGILAHVKACITLRNAHPVLRRGDYKRIHSEGDVMAFSRTHEDQIITLIFNVAAVERTIELPFGKSPRILFGDPIFDIQKDLVRITLPARSGVALG